MAGSAVRERIIQAFLIEEQKIVKKVLKIQKSKENWLLKLRLKCYAISSFTSFSEHFSNFCMSSLEPRTIFLLINRRSPKISLLLSNLRVIFEWWCLSCHSNLQS
nr:hypothetical protein PHYPA_010674 [Physcomitrium patens]